jgi:hypothetical protein
MKCLPLVLLFLSGPVFGQSYIQIDYSRKPPEDFPNMRVEVVYGDEEQMKRWCTRVPEASMGKVIGCAKLHFQWDLCMVFLSSNNEEHLKHEKAHCEGYGHVGVDRTPVDEWREHVAKQRQ